MYGKDRKSVSPLGLCFQLSFVDDNLLLIIYISIMGFVVNPVKLLHILIAISFYNSGQADF